MSPSGEAGDRIQAREGEGRQADCQQQCTDGRAVFRETLDVDGGTCARQLGCESQIWSADLMGTPSTDAVSGSIVEHGRRIWFSHVHGKGINAGFHQVEGKIIQFIRK